ncbi:MAG: hypothetical protein ACK4RK_06130 [Gemmataceae bacterium]
MPHSGKGTAQNQEQTSSQKSALLRTRSRLGVTPQAIRGNRPWMTCTAQRGEDHLKH